MHNILRWSYLGAYLEHLRVGDPCDAQEYLESTPKGHFPTALNLSLGECDCLSATFTDVPLNLVLALGSVHRRWL
jgi:hypothetical protein